MAMQYKELKIGVRGDSLLSTRHDLAKKKSFRSFKSEFVDHFSQTFGPCRIDYELNPDQLVRAVTSKIQNGTSFDILLVGVGMNDLLENVDKNILKAEWPAHLDEDLRGLASAIREKAQTNLVLVGGPADVWDYHSRWDAFVVRAYQILTEAGCTMVPIAEVATIMRQMQLSFDKLHFAHEENTRELFAKAWTYWLQSHAGIRPADPATLASYNAVANTGWGWDEKCEARKKKREEIENVPERKFGVRSDSLLNTRSTCKKKAWKTFKGGFCEKWWETFGPIDVNYDVSNAETIREVIASVQTAPSFEVLVVGIGLNDLLNKSWAKSEVKHEWPPHLNQDLVELAAAIKGKAQAHLVIVGGPAARWGYPAHWDNFIAYAQQVLEHVGIVTVPLAEAAGVMMQMPLCYDGIHFAHCDENKILFGKSVTSWLLNYAGVKPKEDGVKRQRQ